MPKRRPQSIKARASARRPEQDESFLARTPTWKLVAIGIGALVFFVGIGLLIEGEEKGYVISNVRVADAKKQPEGGAESEGTWRVLFDARWRGGGEPRTQNCSYTLLGPGGQELRDGKFGLLIATGSARNQEVAGLPDDGARPADARVQCEGSLVVQ